MKVETWPFPTAQTSVAGAAAVVIDVLRASTTIITALENGAARVFPVGSVDNAFAMARQLPGALLGGERGAVKVEGFDLGNSPFEYTPQVVAGRDVVITTTNGTQAAEAAKEADEMIVAGFINASAAAQYLRALDKPVVILCAGTKRRCALEDAVCAGMLADKLTQAQICDFTRLCRETYRAHKADLPDFLCGSAHAQTLRQKGFARDLQRAFAVDLSSVVPRRDACGALVAY